MAYKYIIQALIILVFFNIYPIHLRNNTNDSLKVVLSNEKDDSEAFNFEPGEIKTFTVFYPNLSVYKNDELKIKKEIPLFIEPYLSIDMDNDNYKITSGFFLISKPKCDEEVMLNIQEIPKLQ